MSNIENQPDNPASDAPDHARETRRPSFHGAELAGSQRAEPMSREEYADQVRQHQNALSNTPPEPVADSAPDARDTESLPAETESSSDQFPAGDLDDGRGQDELSPGQSGEDQLADSDNLTPGNAETREPTEAPGAPESGSELLATDGIDPPGPPDGPPGPPDGEPDGDRPDEVQRQFLEKLAGLEQRLREEEIPYALFGSLAASAYIDEGRSLDFHRQHAHDPTERVPDIDLLVPRDSLDRIRPYIEEVRNSDFPVKIDTFWAESWVDLRPDAEHSYLTHGDIRIPARSELFTPCQARLLGQEFTTLDPRTLLGLYSTVGVFRKQDVPRVTGLANGIASGATPSRFTEQDCKVFDDFMNARKRGHPVFMASKRAWVGLLDKLPPPASRALKHHVQLRADDAFKARNRRRQAGD